MTGKKLRNKNVIKHKHIDNTGFETLSKNISKKIAKRYWHDIS